LAVVFWTVVLGAGGIAMILLRGFWRRRAVARRRLDYYVKRNFSYGQLTEYVALLVKKGLLEYSEVVGRSRFRCVLKTTEKGVRFLESLRSLDML